MSTDLTQAPPTMEDFLPDNLPEREAEVAAEVAAAKAKAEGIQVTTDAEAQIALEASKEINRTLKAIEAESEALRQPRRQAADEIKRRYDDLKAPFEAADQEIRGKLGTYTAEQQRKQREEEERLERERLERERIAKEARERQEAEAEAARMKAEEDAQAARELAAEEGSEEAERLAAEEQARAHQAQVAEQAIQGLPEPEMPRQVVPAAPKLNGFSRPERWEAEVVDFAALPDVLPDGTPLKVVDQVALNSWMNGTRKANGGEPTPLAGAKFEKRPYGTRVVA